MTPPAEPPANPSTAPPGEPPLSPPPGQSRRRVPRVSTVGFAQPDLPPPQMPMSTSTLHDTQDATSSAPRPLTPLLVAPLPALEGPSGRPRSNATQVQRTQPTTAQVDPHQTRSLGAETTGETVSPLPVPSARRAGSRRTSRPQPVKAFTPAG